MMNQKNDYSDKIGSPRRILFLTFFAGCPKCQEMIN